MAKNAAQWTRFLAVTITAVQALAAAGCVASRHAAYQSHLSTTIEESLEANEEIQLAFGLGPYAPNPTPVRLASAAHTHLRAPQP